LTAAIFSRAAGQAHHHVGDLLAHRRRAGGLAVRAAEHRHVGMRAPCRAAGDHLVQRRQQHLVARAFSCSAWLVLLMSSLVQAKCTNSLAPLQFGPGLELGLDPVLDRLHVVVGGLFDVLDGRGVGLREVLDQAQQVGAGARGSAA
jgi:hypothetical protein